MKTAWINAYVLGDILGDKRVDQKKKIYTCWCLLCLARLVKKLVQIKGRLLLLFLIG